MIEVHKWCYLCRALNQKYLIMHMDGCPPELVMWESEEEE